MQVLQKGGRPYHRARIEREREREKPTHRGLHKKHTSPKPLTVKRRGADYFLFLQAVELKV